MWISSRRVVVQSLTSCSEFILDCKTVVFFALVTNARGLWTKGLERVWIWRVGLGRAALKYRTRGSMQITTWNLSNSLSPVSLQPLAWQAGQIHCVWSQFLYQNDSFFKWVAKFGLLCRSNLSRDLDSEKFKHLKERLLWNFHYCNLLWCSLFWYVTQNQILFVSLTIVIAQKRKLYVQKKPQR